MRLPATIAAFQFSGDVVRLAVVKTGGRHPVLAGTHVAHAVYDDEEHRFEALVEAVRTAHARAKKLRPSAYVLCAPGGAAVARHIPIHLRGRRKVAAAVQFELEPYLAFPIEELVVDFNVIREAEGVTDVLAVGMRKKTLDEPLAVLEAAGVEIDGINLDAAGLAALWHSGQKRGPGVHALVQAAGDAVIVSIVRDKALALFRRLAAPPAAAEERPEAAAREVQNTVRAFLATWKKDEPLASVTVTGFSNAQPMAKAIEEGMGVPVREMDLLEAVTSRKGRQVEALGADPAEAGIWAAMAGTAVAAAGGPFGFNFRKGELAPPNQYTVLMRHAVFSAALALIALFGYTAYCYADYRQNRAEIERIGQEIWQAFVTTFPDAELAQGPRLAGDDGGLRSFDEYQREAERYLEAAGTTVITPEMLKRPKFLDILKEIAEKMPEDRVNITSLSLRPDRRRARLEIQGTVTNDAAFNQAFEELRASDLFEVGEDADRSSGGGAETNFTIMAWL